MGQVFHFELSHARVKIAIHVGPIGVMVSKFVIDQVFLVCVVAVLDERYNLIVQWDNSAFPGFGFHTTYHRTRKNELKIYLSDNEKYILDRKVELSKRKSAADYIQTLILFGFVYDVDYSYLRQYNETLGKISGNLNQIAKRINSTGNIYEEDMAEVKAIMDEVWRTQKAMLKKQPLVH